MRRVVVTGMGIVSSIGNTVEEVLAALREGRSGIVHADKYAELGFRCHVHGAPDLDWHAMVPRKPRRFMEAGLAWNYIAMEQAIRGCRAWKRATSSNRAPASSWGRVDLRRSPSSGRPRRRSRRDRRKSDLSRCLRRCASGPSALLATSFKITGINYSISSACSTSAHCIGNAAEQIAWGKQDVVFAGGCEELDWTLSVLFDAMGAMSSGFNDTPQKASRAYDKDRDGFVIAGGAGVLVLEELEHAKARGAKIYGELVGYGATSDGFDMVAPSGEGAVRCMRQAMEGIDGKDVGTIDYINPHATSTPVGDEREIEAIREVFGEKIPYISATKSLTGHSLGAIGVQESIFSLLMMNNGFICESANIDELDPEFSGLPIVRERIDNASLNCVMSNSFGFGGTNASLVFRRYDG